MPIFYNLKGEIHEDMDWKGFTEVFESNSDHDALSNWKTTRSTPTRRSFSPRSLRSTWICSRFRPTQVESQPTGFGQSADAERIREKQFGGKILHRLSSRHRRPRRAWRWGVWLLVKGCLPSHSTFVAAIRRTRQGFLFVILFKLDFTLVSILVEKFFIYAVRKLVRNPI